MQDQKEPGTGGYDVTDEESPRKKARRSREDSGEEDEAKRSQFGPKLCHPKQRAMVEDRSRTVVVCGGRRGGKSFGAVVKAIETCRENDGVVVIYVSATRTSAKKMAFNPAVKLNRDHCLGAKVNLTELTLTFPNESQLQIMGVDSEPAADKTRGIPKMRLAIVDEAQRYKPEILQYLLRDCLRPGLLDAGDAGALWILGTPSPHGQTGEFWARWDKPENRHAHPADSFHDPDGADQQAAGFHLFTCFDNSYLGKPEDILRLIEADLNDEGKTKESAWYQREYLCAWVVELSERAYQFDGERNVYRALPPNVTNFLICGDTGVKDADALALLGWADKLPDLYLVKEHIRRGQDVDDLGAILWEWWVQFKPCRIVLDAGANAKAVLTLQNRYRRLPIFAADKPPLNLQIAELNLFLTSGIFKVRAESRFAREVRLPTWKNGVVNGKLLETGSKKSDIVPAVRYGCLAVRPFLPDPPEPKTPVGTEAAIDELMKVQYVEGNPWQGSDGSFPPGDDYNPFQN